MSPVFDVLKNGYYWSPEAHPSIILRENQALKFFIIKLWEPFRNRFISPRIQQYLFRSGRQGSRPYAALPMQKAGITSNVRQKRSTTSDHNKIEQSSTLNRDSNYGPLFKVWISNIPVLFVKVDKGCQYLKIAIDLSGRKEVGGDVSLIMESDNTAITAFKKAVAKRNSNPEMNVYSDLGRQYYSKGFRYRLDSYQNKQSMNLKDNYRHNGFNTREMSFFKSMKYVTKMGIRFKRYSQAQRVRIDYIEYCYINHRLNSIYGYRTLIENEQQLTNNFAA